VQIANKLREYRHLPTAEVESELNLLERNWFAAHKRYEIMRARCDELLHAMELAHANWRNAQSELNEIESTRDVLAREYERSISSEEPPKRTWSMPASAA
jgi:hypothetical protein